MNEKQDHSDSHVSQDQEANIKEFPSTAAITIMSTTTAKKKIRHLVISGGGLYGFSVLGALEYLHDNAHFFELEDIESIDGTSVGSILGVVLALKFSFAEIREYVLHLHWHNLFNLNLAKLFGSVSLRGIFQKDSVLNLMTPLFAARDVPVHINMHDFFETTRIDLHIYVVEVTQFVLVDINHKTHPEWKVMDAIYASSAFPGVFSPLAVSSSSSSPSVPPTPTPTPTPNINVEVGVDDSLTPSDTEPQESVEQPQPQLQLQNECRDTPKQGTNGVSLLFYADGALLCNNPLPMCLKRTGIIAREVLAIHKQKPAIFEDTSVALSDSTSIAEYLVFLLHQMISRNQQSHNQEPGNASSSCGTDTDTDTEVEESAKILVLPDMMNSVSFIQRVLSSIDERLRLMQTGEICAQTFLANQQHQHQHQHQHI